MQDWQGDMVMAIGFALYAAASVLSVIEEWPKQGLTDTSYLALILWMAGGAVLSFGAYMLGFWLMLNMSLIACLATGIGLGLKLRDTKRYRRHR
jgi:CHASE2 domain-containing sensor protein